MRMSRLKTLEKYWAKYPPIHVLFSQHVGYEAPKVETEKANTAEENCMALFLALGGTHENK